MGCSMNSSKKKREERVKFTQLSQITLAITQGKPDAMHLLEKLPNWQAYRLKQVKVN